VWRLLSGAKIRLNEYIPISIPSAVHKTNELSSAHTNVGASDEMRFVHRSFFFSTAGSRWLCWHYCA
jgi:hypothetical protein